MVNCYYIYGGSSVLHLWLNIITFMVGRLLHLWSNVIAFMVGITFMVVITFMGDTVCACQLGEWMLRRTDFQTHGLTEIGLTTNGKINFCKRRWSVNNCTPE